MEIKSTPESNNDDNTISDIEDSLDGSDDG